MKKAIAILSIILFVGPSLAATSDLDWPTKTTPEQRIKIAAAIRALEATALLDDTKADRTAAFSWVVQTPDVDLKWCAALLVDLPKNESKLWGGLMVQAILSATAFSIENPSGAGDQLLVARAGVSGALRTYETTVAERPTPRSRFFDDLLMLEAAGKLDDYIKPKVEECNAAAK